METKPLEEIGFTRGESKVYMALLDIGPSTTGQIIKTAQVSRSKVYEMLDKLIANGLVSFVLRDNVKYYSAASPSVIIDIIEKRRSALSFQKKNLEKTISEMSKRQSRSPQTARVYEGTSGIKSIYKSVLDSVKPKDEYFACQVESEIFSSDFADFIRDYHKLRAKKGIMVKLLCMEEDRKIVNKVMKGLADMEIRFTKQPIPLSTLVFGNQVATFVWGANPVGIIIESKAISLRYKKFLSSLWQTSKK